MRTPAILLEDGRIEAETVKAEVGRRVQALAGVASTPLLLLSKRTVESVYWLLATIYAGRTAAFLPEESTRAERQTAARTIGAKDCLDPSALSLGSSAAPLREDLVENFRLVVFSSGTTAAPKAIVLPFRSLEASALAHGAHFSLSAKDIWLASLPLTQIGGISIVTRALLLGQDLAFANTSDVRTLANWMLSGKISGASIVPTMLHRLGASNAGLAWHPNLRYLLIGGAEIPNSVWRDVTQRFPSAPLYPTYGLSETSSQILTSSTIDPLFERREKLRPLNGVGIRLREDGELLAAGDMLFAGYYSNGEFSPRQEEWFATGDMASVTDTDAYFVTGRRDDVIVSGGFNISPLEVEDAFRRLHPERECALVGVPDKEWGQIAVLVCSGGDKFDTQAALSAMRADLSAKKVPKKILCVENLPRTKSGKILRRELRELISGR